MATGGWRSRALWRTRPYLAPYHRHITFIVISSIVSSAGMVAVPLIVKQVIDGPLADGDRAGIARWAALMAVIAVVEVFLAFGRRLLLTVLSTGLETSLRDDLYAQLQRLDVGFHDRWQSGQLLSRAMTDLSVMRRFIGFGAIFFVLILVQVAGHLRGAPRAAPAARPAHVRGHDPGAWSSATASSCGTWRSSGASRTRPATSPPPSRRAPRASASSRPSGGATSPSPATRPRRSRSTTRRWSASRSTPASCGCSALIPNLTLTLVLLAGVLAVGSGGLTLGGLVAFVSYVLMLTFPLEILAWIMALAGEAESAAVRIYEVFDTEPTIQDRPGALVLDEVRGDIRFEGVSFTYEGSDRTVLTDIDLTVAAGEIVAVVGATGSGKTTLVTLLTRLYDPTDGRITLDGHDLRDLTVNSLRRHVGFAFEEPSLFSASVRENLLMGKPDATEAEVLAALEVAQADFAFDLPWGLDTRIGEQGLSLSGGQRQRLALARAIIGRPAGARARRSALGGRRAHGGRRPGGPAAAARGLHGVHRRAPPLDGGAGPALDPPRRGPPRRRRHPPRPARRRAPLPRRAVRGRRGAAEEVRA